MAEAEAIAAVRPSVQKEGSWWTSCSINLSLQRLSAATSARRLRSTTLVAPTDAAFGWCATSVRPFVAKQVSQGR